MTLAGSKIDSSIFYYCEESDNLNSCSLTVYVGYSMKKAKVPNMNNSLDTRQNMSVNIARLTVTLQM